jgi:hypothetical protein
VVYLPIAQTGKNLVVFPTLTIVYPHIVSWAPLALLRCAEDLPQRFPSNPAAT